MDNAEAVHAYLQRLVTASAVPGVQYLVVDSTHTIFQYTGGWADIGRRVPMDAATTLMAYSMSKTITAVAVLQLVDAGKLRLDDPVSRYVDSLPYAGITVRQLLSHTAGVPNPIPLRWVHLADRHASFDGDAALRSVLREHPRLARTPGTKYAYSNVGYWLLGTVIERASGEPFETYVARHLFAPLGIAPSDLGYAILDPAHQATGYLEKYSLMNLAKGFLLDRAFVGEYAGSWLSIRSHYPNGAAFGGLVGTARGFGTFLQDEQRAHSRLLSDSMRALLFTPQVASGQPVPMTLGWHVGDLHGRRYFYKLGGGGGFHHVMRVYPESAIATVVMTNATGFDVERCLDTADPAFVR